MSRVTKSFREGFPTLSDTDPQFVTAVVDYSLRQAREALASDIHLVPGPQEWTMHWRLDGVLQPIRAFSPQVGTRLVARLKVLAQLLTYRNDVPQEGRIVASAESSGAETRISTFPTLFGEKVVVRLFVGAGNYQRVSELGLPDDVATAYQQLLERTSGVVLVTGPAGSGKTTTVYAGLRELAEKTHGGRSLVSLEDPIEVVVPGVSQSQVHPSAGFDMATGLRSLMRQDPEVILVGEIRDQSTAQVVMQAALTGHLVLTTFHANSSAGAVNRLSDMGIEPYLLRATIQGILNQRLLRRLCDCARITDDAEFRLGWDVERVRIPQGCDLCFGTGYKGRFLLAELLLPRGFDVCRAILNQAEAAELESHAVAAGMVTQRMRAQMAIATGVTSPEEIWRAIGSNADRASAD